MKPKLYLHIGHSKVASSSIQSYMDNNIDAIRRAGYLVANIDGHFPTSGPIASCPVGILQQARNAGPRGIELVEARLQELLETIDEKSQFSKAIISAENLCNPGFEPMYARAREDFEVQLIYYIRRQDEWLVSAWKQWGIKSGKNLREFCQQGTASRYPAFAATINRWEPLVDSMHVRPLHSSVLDGGLVTADFASAVGLDPTTLRDTGVSNPSFDAAVLEMLSKNPYLFEHSDDNRMFDFLTEFLSPEIKPMRAELDWHTRMSICRYFEAENRKLLARFFPTGDYEEIFSLPEAGFDLQPPQPQELLYRFLGLQMRALMDMHTEIKRLRNRL